VTAEKLCIFCRHFTWEHFWNEPAYCDSGFDTLYGGLWCKAGHFQSLNPSNEDELRAVFLRAETCKNYERP
jgi:hypothetical protein